jgi:hypothetical protein
MSKIDGGVATLEKSFVGDKNITDAVFEVAKALQDIAYEIAQLNRKIGEHNKISENLVSSFNSFYAQVDETKEGA